MLIINLHPDGHAVGDSRLLSGVLQAEDTARMVAAVDPARDYTWNVDRHDVFYAASWLIINGKLDRDFVRFEELGRPIALDQDGDFLDPTHDDPAFDLVFKEDPAILRQHHVRSDGTVWLRDIPEE